MKKDEMREEYDFTRAKRGLLYKTKTKSESRNEQIKQSLAVCVKTVDTKLLVLRKIYDVRFLSNNLVEVIGEDQETSIYPADFFMPLTLPKEVEKVLSQVTI